MENYDIEKTGYNICKFVLIVFTVVAVVARIMLDKNNLTDADINLYMAFVNFFSLLFSLNTFMLAVYLSLKKAKGQLRQDGLIGAC